MQERRGLVGKAWMVPLVSTRDSTTKGAVEQKEHNIIITIIVNDFHQPTRATTMTEAAATLDATIQQAGDDNVTMLQTPQEHHLQEQQDDDMNDVNEMLLLEYLQQQEWGGAMNDDDDDDDQALVLVALQQKEWGEGSSSGQQGGWMHQHEESLMPTTASNMDTMASSNNNQDNSGAPFDETIQDTALMLQEDEAQQEDGKQAALVNNEFETEALLLQTPLGRAHKLVERLVLLWQAHSHYWQEHILLLGHDDIVFMAEQLVQLQETFQQRRRPVGVDVGYHWTRPENVDQIRMDGLLTKREREDLGIQSHYNGSSYGDGVYTADNPYNFYNTYGPVCLLVARLVGFKGKQSDGADVDTVVDNAHRMAVLKSSSQCFPIFSFPQTLFDPSLQSNMDGKALIAQCHGQVQRILDEFLNNGFETPVPLSLHAHRQTVVLPRCRTQSVRPLLSYCHNDKPPVGGSRSSDRFCN